MSDTRKFARVVPARPSPGLSILIDLSHKSETGICVIVGVIIYLTPCLTSWYPYHHNRNPQPRCFCRCRRCCNWHTRRDLYSTSIRVLVIVTRSDPSSVIVGKSYRVGRRPNPSAKLICWSLDNVCANSKPNSLRRSNHVLIRAFSLCCLPKISDNAWRSEYITIGNLLPIPSHFT